MLNVSLSIMSIQLTSIVVAQTYFKHLKSNNCQRVLYCVCFNASYYFAYLIHYSKSAHKLIKLKGMRYTINHWKRIQNAYREKHKISVRV